MAFSCSGEAEFSRCLEAARAGSPEALGRLLEMCRPYLLGVGNQQLEMDLQAKAGASDLVQETFLEAQRGFSGFHGANETELLAWLRQILLNNFANLRRHYRDTDKRELRREVALNDPAADNQLAVGDSPSSHAQAQERDAALHRALQQLPEQSRLVIQWRNYERCSFEDIGKRLGRSPEAARKLWVRAIEQLQKILEPGDAAS